MNESLIVGLAVQTGTPVLIWGSPGTGKTSFLYRLAEQLDLHLEVVISSLREPSDFAGLPVLTQDGVRFEPPTWAKRLSVARRGLLFLDELTTAAPAVQKALLRVVHERTVGDLELPPSVAIVAAANPPDEAADGWELSPPLANRFMHVRWRGLPAEEWAAALVTGRWPAVPLVRLPRDWDTGPAAIRARALVAGFIRARPMLLHRQPDDPSAAGQAWPSRRTWEMAARMLAAVFAAGLDEEVAILAVAGCVGEAAALEFAAYMRELDLPDPEQLLADPDRFVPPERGDVLSAVLGAVVAATLDRLTIERWRAAWEILGRAAQAAGPDVAAVAASELARRRGTMPLPAEVNLFVPLLKRAGVLP